MKYIVHLIGGHSIRVTADHYIVNKNTGEVEFFTPDQERVPGIQIFIHGVAAILEDRGKSSSASGNEPT